ncbi:hypothetical protein KUTeg_005565 [Tegillarca granosa]|uniref:28S ribosomal protein S18c, mitochondrial n=1 Tax=Tegillarca granosa TaxID=220873 RepID=A0ABQ9FK41_TEGGR|nr:hypothetical protein KUTeg_005565 [Tegillarca granosa]
MSGKLRYKNRHSEPFPLDKVDEILHDLHKKNLIDTNEILTTGPSPFEQEVRKCILCTKRIELDYKNVRLLNQFISSKTGVMFQRESTGLCIPMYNRIKELIQRSRAFGKYILVKRDDNAS